MALLFYQHNFLVCCCTNFAIILSVYILRDYNFDSSEPCARMEYQQVRPRGFRNLFVVLQPPCLLVILEHHHYSQQLMSFNSKRKITNVWFWARSTFTCQCTLTSMHSEILPFWALRPNSAWLLRVYFVKYLRCSNTGHGDHFENPVWIFDLRGNRKICRISVPEVLVHVSSCSKCTFDFRLDILFGQPKNNFSVIFKKKHILSMASLVAFDFSKLTLREPVPILYNPYCYFQAEYFFPKNSIVYHCLCCPNVQLTIVAFCLVFLIAATAESLPVLRNACVFTVVNNELLNHGLTYCSAIDYCIRCGRNQRGIA